MLRLLLNSLAPSTQQAYVRAWREFTRSGACRREDEQDRLEDVIHLIMELEGTQQSRITISGKDGGVHLSFMGMELCLLQLKALKALFREV
ncbi:hypothetical protein NDU88_005643 [Pleurodeles waltl]|uniref:Uncharacterized protein n=1 Tax=Pleurodeles waltl TaxID=8319 RepID=A0AAV7NMZ9_PLEWA|nr:hypothetical protein NDU88_005643 [Pleurodeles waltl]